MAWKQTTLGHLAGVVGGGTPPTGVPEYWGGDVPWFTPAEIPESGAGVVTRSKRSITSKGLAKSAAKLLPAGSVLVTSRASIGNCAITGVPTTTNQGFTSLVPEDPRSTRYLYYWVQQHRNRFLSRAAGSTFLEVSASKVRAISIDVPGLDEQAAIGEALADADDLIATLERLIAKKQAIKQGMMQQLLTGRTRLPGFTEAWHEVALDALATVDPETLSAGTNPGTMLDYISLEDVERGELLGHTRVPFGSAPSRARRVIQESDVLFGTVRPNLQSHTIYYGGLRRPIASTGFAVVRADAGRSDPRFLYYVLMSHLTTVQIDRIIAGSNYPAVSSRDLRGLVLSLPPVDEQRAIGSALADCDDEVSVLKNRLVKARAVKAGMMQKLLIGRTCPPVEEGTA